jgi:cerevisin
MGKVTAFKTLNNVPWGLQRISQQGPLGNADPTDSNFSYTFDDSAGEGVDIYIVDTGILTTHQEFGGRATFATSLGSGTANRDVQGHGTHVAGIAASSGHGVASKANVFAVKVMGDDGTAPASDIIAGINFVAFNAATTGNPSVINLSVSTPPSRALDTACSNAVSMGVHVVVAAGNDNRDATGDSPARSEDVITVGATDINDQRASFSNSGPAVDIWAPGVGIISLSNSGNNLLRTLDGTSMATPFVTGLVAYLIGLEGNKTPAIMKQRITELAISGAISGLARNDTNTLLSNGMYSFPLSSLFLFLFLFLHSPSLSPSPPLLSSFH